MDPPCVEVDIDMYPRDIAIAPASTRIAPMGGRGDLAERDGRP
jgi:hypothetical protein